MSPHELIFSSDRYSAMDYQYYDPDQYYDHSLPIFTNYSDYSSSQSYCIADTMMLAVTNLQGEQLIQKPAHEYHQGNINIASPSIHSFSPESCCLASVDSHHGPPYSNIPTYSSERRPSYPSSWVQDVRNNLAPVAASQSSEYRATIARLSDDFLANASSLFGGSPSRIPNASTALTGLVTPLPAGNFTPARKRSSDAMIEEVFIDQQVDAHSHTASTEDPRYLPQPHMIVPSQNRVVHERQPPQSSFHGGKSQDLRQSPPRPFIPSVLPNSLLLPDEVHHQSNKRLHRSEEISSHSHITSITPATWSAQEDSVMKVSAPRKTGEQKKQALACLFCRERKIACGRPSAHSRDQTCNQCARRRMKCEYPTESRRGQHKRIRRKPIEENTGVPNLSLAPQSAPNTPHVITQTT